MSDNSPELTDHCGNALKSAADIFAAAPPEIGPVLSLGSSLKKTDQQRSLSTRVASTVIIAGIVTGIGLLVEVGIGIAIDGPGSFVVPLGLGAIAALIRWLSIGFSHTLTYVGKRGVATFTMIGTRERITRTELFLFKHATELRTSRTRHLMNGQYMGTRFDFSWFNDADEKLYTIADLYDSTDKAPQPSSRYQYALAAEAAWSNHLLRRLKTELKRTGAIDFNVGLGEWIRIRPGFLDLHLKGHTEHCAAADIAKVSVADGVFTIKLRNASDGWFSSSGIFSFTYGTMANAQVFLLALDELLGLTLD